MAQRKSKRFVGGWLLIALLCLPGGIGADTGDRAAPLSDLLEQAIFAEESLGDLDQAIEIYQEILRRAEAEKSFIAQAQLRLGMCYLKKGEREAAVEVLQRLVADFPGQKDLVHQARTRLGELGVSMPAERLRLTKVWDNAGGATGSPSADGQYLTFTDWSTGNLAIHDFRTDRDRALTAKDGWHSDPSFAEFSVLSPDETRVAYAWFGRGPRYELRLINTDGSGERVLYSAPDIFWIWPIGWAPDSQRILTYFSRESGQQMAWIALDGTASEPIGRREYPDTMIDLSPDGELIAYDLDQDTALKRRDIYLLDATTGEETPLVVHPADERVLGFSPDGRHLVFLSDRTGQWSLWAVPLEGGRAAGPPELLKDDMGGMWPDGKLYPMGFTRQGSFFYSVQNQVADIYVSTLGSEQAGTPSKVTQRFEGSNTAPEWSADGSRMAWLSKRPTQFVLVIRDLASGAEREVPVADRLYQVSGGIRWSPDGGSFLVCGTAKRQESWQGIFAIDAKTGEVNQLAAADSKGVLRNALWSANGESIYFERRSGDGGAIVALDLESGTEEEIAPGYFGRVALSHDGKRLAVTTDRFVGHTEPSIRVVSVATGEAREIYRGTASEAFDPRTPLAWMPDGKHVLVGKGALKPGAAIGAEELEVWKIPVEGGEPEPLGLKRAYLANVKVHPDGKRIAFEAGSRRPEVWRLENFLPQVAEGR